MALTQINSNSITDGSITNADISSSAAIDESKLTITSVGGANGVDFNDSVKARFGTGNDLEIEHTGSGSFIRTSTTATGDLAIEARNGGDLYLTGADDVLIRPQGGEAGLKVVGNGAVEAYYDNAKKLETTSTGINVTGTVTCDGLTSDGDITAQSGVGVINVKDTGNTGVSAQTQINWRDSANTNQAKIGMLSSSNDDLYINAELGGINFSTQGVERAWFDDNGHFRPNASNTYDLGSASNQWRNGYFDGTVNCDGLTSEGDITLKSNNAFLIIQDADNDGVAAQQRIVGNDSLGNTDWYIGQVGTTNNDIYISNQISAAVIFRTGSVERCYVNANGHLQPWTNNTYDLGTSTNRWRNVYTNDLNLSNEGGTNDVDGTWGSWTIQEGEDDLFLLNRRNGKKYKFNLSEVN